MKTTSTTEVITAAEVRAVCLLYRAAIDAGRGHDDAAQFAADLDPRRLVTEDGQHVDIEKIGALADRFTPKRLDMYDRTPEGETARLLTAIAVAEGMLTGDPSSVTLLPTAPPDAAALMAAQTAVTVMILETCCKGNETSILNELRAAVLNHGTDKDQP